MPSRARRATLKLNRKLQNASRVERGWGDGPLVCQLRTGLVALVSMLVAAGLGARLALR
jgi:hypothetical protein